MQRLKPRPVTVKLSKDKDRFFKAMKENTAFIKHKESSISLTADFALETVRDEKQ